METLITIFMKLNKNPVEIALNKNEIDSLKEFADENLERGTILIHQSSESGIGLTTRVLVKGLPETLTDITDTESW